MKRSGLIAAAVIVAVAALALLFTSVRRVPENHQAIRVADDGTVSRYGPGLHFARPFSSPLLVYPMGKMERRFPAEGVWEVRTSGGERVGSAITLSLELSPDSGEFIYREFGESFEDGLSDLVRESVEIEAARRPFAGGSLDELADAVVEQLRPELGKAGIRVLDRRIEVFEAIEGAVVAQAPPPLRRIVFLGVDGGDWTIIRPMMAEGLLPNFKRLVEEGSTGPLRSIEPLLSPLIWTSIATGKLPEEHGILNFTVVDPETGERRPISRLSRRADAVWNMLGDYGRKVGVVGWLASHPAEDVNGVVVSDRVGYLAYADAADGDTLAPGSVSPPSRAGEMAALVVRSADVKYDDFRPILDLGRDAFENKKRSAFDPDDPVNNLIMLYASVRSYDAIAKHLLARDRPDFLGVYFEWCDAVGHLFMSYSPPRLDWVDAAGYEKYKNVMRETYVLQDRIIGEYMDAADEGTVIVIASDHGFKSGTSRPRLAGEIGGGHAAFWHQPNGIVGLWGSGIRRGYEMREASVLDLAPTLLALQSLPQAADMPGRVLIDAFEDSLAGRVNQTVVATLQRARSERARAVPGDAGGEEALKKLEALGYITPENPDAYNNLGQRYRAQGEYEKAIEEFKKALAINPNFPSALNNIGVCYGHVGRYAEAEQSFKRAIALKKDDVYAMNNLAVMYMQTGETQKALEYARMAVSTEPSYAIGRVTLGSVQATLGNLDEAEREFSRALELDPANRSARTNLERVRAEKAGRDEDAGGVR